MPKEILTNTKILGQCSRNLGCRLFLIISLSLIALSAIHAIPVDGGGKIGIMANPLSIGDRGFYIDDANPWVNINTQTGNKASPLYPFLLRFYSSIVALAGFSSTTPAWNLCAIATTWTASLATLIIVKRIALAAFHEGAANRAAIIYSLCPYTYYYILSGGLTAIFLCTFTAYTLQIIRAASRIQQAQNITTASWIGQITLATLLVLLRPSGLPIVATMQLGITIYIATVLISKKKSSKSIQLRSGLKSSLFCLVICTVISISSLAPNQVYVKNSLRAYEVEGGTHLGVSRSHIKDIVSDLMSRGEIVNTLAGGAILSGWRFSDAFLGLNDARDTYTSIPSRPQTLGVIFRGLTSIFFMLPMSYAALATTYIYRRKIIRSGFWIPVAAMLVTLAYSLLGFPMSRYYILVWTPAACLAGLFWHTTEELRRRDL